MEEEILTDLFEQYTIVKGFMEQDIMETAKIFMAFFKFKAHMY